MPEVRGRGVGRGGVKRYGRGGRKIDIFDWYIEHRV